ncbi:MAG: hypothetical protein ACRELX_16580 [Longimicrobiales bacterium]
MIVTTAMLAAVLISLGAVTLETARRSLARDAAARSQRTTR